MYYKEARNFINKVIRIRAHLNKTGKGLKSIGMTNHDIDFLKRHLQAHPYNKDAYMANFFYRNAHKIKNLLPSKNNDCRLDREFDELFSMALHNKTTTNLQLN